MAASKVTELHFAIKTKNFQLVKKIVDGGCDLNYRVRNVIALSVAILNNEEEVVYLLLERGANPDLRSKDTSGRLEPPIVSACRVGNIKIVQHLLAWSADINAKDFYGHTALWTACKQLNIELVDLLLNNGTRLSRPSLWSECPLYLTTKEMDTSATTRENIARRLILAGFRSNCKDSRGRDSFYWSVLHRANKTAILLLKSGYRPSRTLIDDNEEILTKMSLEFLELLVFTVENIPSLAEMAKKTIRLELESMSQGKEDMEVKIRSFLIPKSLMLFLLEDPLG